LSRACPQAWRHDDSVAKHANSYCCEPGAVAPYLGSPVADTSTARCIRSMPRSATPVGSLAKINAKLFQCVLSSLSAEEFAHLCMSCKSMRAEWELDVGQWTRLCVCAATVVECLMGEMLELSGNHATGEHNVTPVISIEHVRSALRDDSELAAALALWGVELNEVAFYACGAQACVLRNCTDGEWV